MNDCARERCGHGRRHHGRGTGKCWAPNMRCSCPAFVQPAEGATVDGTEVHVLPEQDLRRAIYDGLLVPFGR
jgi:hypothetical protein